MQGKKVKARLRGEGRLTSKMLSKKLQRGKGPLLHFGDWWAAHGKATRDSDHGLR